jgi:hypothetical protein
MHMNYQKLIALAVAITLWHGARADGSYEETAQMTGGTMKQIAGMTSVFSPSGSAQLQKANSTIVIVQGNRQARINANTSMIIDLDKQLMTRIDNTKKQYSVMTFDEMRKQMEETQAQMKALMEEHKGDPAPELPKELSDNPPSFDAKAVVTGATKTISGLATHEVLLTETMTFHDPKGGGNDTLTYYFKNDVWLADSVPPGWQEIEDFKKRIAEKWPVSPAGAPNSMAMLTAAHPGLADGLKKLGEEMKKQHGVPVMVVQQFGAHAEGDSVAAANNNNTALGSTGTTMTNEVISNTASETAQKEASQISSNGNLGILGSSLLQSAVGVFSKHAPDLTKTATSSATTAATPKSGKPASVDRVMSEQTTIVSNFSTEKAPASAFDVPAGYTKVDWVGPKKAQ